MAGAEFVTRDEFLESLKAIHGKLDALSDKVRTPVPTMVAVAAVVITILSIFGSLSTDLLMAEIRRLDQISSRQSGLIEKSFEMQQEEYRELKESITDQEAWMESVMHEHEVADAHPGASARIESLMQLAEDVRRHMRDGHPGRIEALVAGLQRDIAGVPDRLSRLEAQLEERTRQP